MFIALLDDCNQLANHHVIARKPEGLTWQSPSTMLAFTLLIDRLKQEIATSRYALLAMTVVAGGWLRLFARAIN